MFSSNYLTYICLYDDVITIPVYPKHRIDAVWNRDRFPVDADDVVLQQRDRVLPEGQEDRLGPGERFGVAAIIAYSDPEVVGTAVGREKILAAALEVEESAIERSVVGIPENCADSIFWRE